MKKMKNCGGGYRKQKLALVAGVVLSAGLALTGCDLSEELQKDKNESGDSSQSFSITFDYGNDIKTTHKYTSNDTYKPDIPQKKGYDFKGWYLGDSETPFSFENLDLDKDLTLTAVYTPTVYNVKFELNGGTGAGSLTYTIESDKVVLPTPKRNGYNFDGWYETENISEESKIVEEILQGSTGDKTFYAKWTAKSYTITYNLNDGTPAIGSSYTIEDNITLPTSTRKGYTFDGWYETENITDESESVEKILQGSTGNRVFYAKWSLIEYAITYELNGGEFAGSSVKSYTIESDRIDLPTNVTRAGYTFDGWLLNGSDATAIEKGSTGDKTFYAKWDLITYTITYNLNDGTLAEEAVKSYTVESEDISLQTPTRAGYVFGGWYENSGLTGDSVTKISSGSTGNKVLYAKWTANTSTKYTVEYYFENLTNSGYTLDDTMTKEEYGTTDTKTAVTASEVDGYDLQEITQQNIEGNGKAVVEVYYKRHVYTATLNAGKGIASISLSGDGVSGTSVKYGATVTVSATLKTGYENATFSVNETALTGDTFTQSANDSNISASATAIEYTVTYNLNDGSEAQTTTYTVESEDISLQTPTRAGYIFDGWYINENFSGSSVTKISSGSTGNKVLYAKWTKTITKTEFCDFVFADTTDNSFVIDSTVGGFEGAGVSIQYVDPETDGQGGIVKCIKRDYKYYVDANGVVYQSIIVSEIDAENNVTTTLMGYIVGDDVYKKVDGGYEKGSKSDTTNKVVDEINEVLSRGNYLETDYISSLEERVNSADFDSDSDGVMEYTCSTENSMKVYTIIWTPTVGSEKQMKFVYNGNNIVKFHCVEVESGKEYPYPCVEKFSSIEELNLPDFANETITNSTT